MSQLAPSVAHNPALPAGRSAAHGLALALLGTLMMALCAQVKVYLPWSPIPVTLQTFGVMCLALFFPKRVAVGAVVGYLLQIALGFPMLPGWEANPLVLIGPKAGYYAGFIVQAATSAILLARCSSFLARWSVLSLSVFVQLTIGACILSCFVGCANGWHWGFVPFLLGEIAKSALALLFHRTVTEPHVSSRTSP